ncbi:nucleotide exchange factor GrpE [Planosporangium mesophilum]|uniref:Protein GrpE n=1 Tax=Planosporangium mesophilum TaxID=689768 RepID=A0A8J3T9S5_9ACTN|nr:nucleotide exchange factor GrpE [Planosporangium mesophilum]NJC82277.1 nucleotide exchange factor GrpE [Planosporangium mesophilum]GII22329.1 protein GrpE [Planosporangium mesophilum]
MTESRRTDSGSRPDATESRRPGTAGAGRHAAGAPEESAEERVVIRDKRKMKVPDGKHTKSTEADADETAARSGAEAQPDAPAGDVVEEPAASPLGAELESLRTELDERTRDLQRVTAEYANYRKRVERDRALVGEQATGNVLAALLPVLDDLDRARDHGDLVGPFGTVADQLTTALSKFGLTPFGSKGDLFDPNRHEAVAHLTSAEVTEPTCVDVMRRGYLLGERLLRPALVAVADPE